MDVTQNLIYDSLDTERKNMVNAFISFLYLQQMGIEPGDETAQVIQEALRGENIVGSYDTVDELMEALNA